MGDRLETNINAVGGEGQLRRQGDSRSEVEASSTDLIGRLIDLPKITDHRGNLTFIEGKRHLPFDVCRVYYLYDVPAGAMRGGHAHRRLEEFVIAASGSFTVVLNDGRSKRKIFLNRPHYGLYIPRMVWRELEDFSSGAICLVMASEEYNESDYYRDYDEYIATLQK